jgi:hypothetical protein
LATLPAWARWCCAQSWCHSCARCASGGLRDVMCGLVDLLCVHRRLCGCGLVAGVGTDAGVGTELAQH